MNERMLGRRRSALRALVGLALVAGMTVAAGCGEDDEEAGGAKTLSVELTESAPGKLAVTAPESTEGGVVRMEFRNTSKLPADAQLVRVDGNQTAEQFVKEVIDSPEGAPIPPWVHGGGGVGVTPPGGTGSATQELTEGTYHLVASAQAGEEGEGPKPATATIKVSGGEQGGELPEAAATITAEEYKFTAEGLKPGKNTVRFTNAGKELHHALAFPYAPGATLEEVKKAFAEDEPPKGPPPVQFDKASGTTVLDGGVEQVTELNLHPGKHVIVCFINDRKGGPPHVAKGMMTEVDVK